MTQPATTATPTGIEALVERYGAAWDAHDVDAIMALHTPDTEFHLLLGGEPVRGADAVRDAFAAVLTQWPELHFEPRAVHIGADHWVQESTVSAGKDLPTAAGVDIFTVRAGLVASKHTYLDPVAAEQALGAAS